MKTIKLTSLLMAMVMALGMYSTTLAAEPKGEIKNEGIKIEEKAKGAQTMGELVFQSDNSDFLPLDQTWQNHRLWGSDRFDTANAVADEFIKTNAELGEVNKDYPDTAVTPVDTVILANAFDFPDALCATPLSKVANAPILLTQAEYLNEKTARQIRKMNIKNVIIVGGEGVVKNEVIADLIKQCDINDENIIRLGSETRYTTSYEIATHTMRLLEAKGQKIKEVVLMDGFKWQSALVTAPIAARNNMPVLLVPKTRDGWDGLNIKQWFEYMGLDSVETLLLGNQEAGEVPAEVLKEFIPHIEGDMFIPNGGIFATEYINQFDCIHAMRNRGYVGAPTSVFMANGNVFADALTVGALASKKDSYIMLPCQPSEHENDYINKELVKYKPYGYTVDDFKQIVADQVRGNAYKVSHVYYTGGEAVISESSGERLLRK